MVIFNKQDELDTINDKVIIDRDLDDTDEEYDNYDDDYDEE